MNQTAAATTSGGDFPWKEIISIAPDIFWLLAVAIFLWLIGLDRIKSALSRATKIGIAGLEIELKNEVEAAAAAKAANISATEAGRAGRRLAAASDLIAGARILWVDDNPSNNEAEMDTLRGLKVHIDLADSTTAAQARLKAAVYDIVLSDMARGDDTEAGKALIPIVDSAASQPLLIFYVGAVAPVPLGAFGLTTQPHELYHLIVDALSRRRG